MYHNWLEGRWHGRREGRGGRDGWWAWGRWPSSIVTIIIVNKSFVVGENEVRIKPQILSGSLFNVE